MKWPQNSAVFSECNRRNRRSSDGVVAAAVADQDQDEEDLHVHVRPLPLRHLRPFDHLQGQGDLCEEEKVRALSNAAVKELGRRCRFPPFPLTWKSPPTCDELRGASGRFQTVRRSARGEKERQTEARRPSEAKVGPRARRPPPSSPHGYTSFSPRCLSQLHV